MPKKKRRGEYKAFRKYKIDYKLLRGGKSAYLRTTSIMGRSYCEVEQRALRIKGIDIFSIELVRHIKKTGFIGEEELDDVDQVLTDLD